MSDDYGNGKDILADAAVRRGLKTDEPIVYCLAPACGLTVAPDHNLCWAHRPTTNRDLVMGESALPPRTRRGKRA